MTKYIVTAQVRVSVEVDPEKFNEDFMEEFRESFFPFQDIRDHVTHLGALAAVGIIGHEGKDEFVEGYGPISHMGIVLGDPEIDDIEVELEQ